jgi:hypothetical protein
MRITLLTAAALALASSVAAHPGPGPVGSTHTVTNPQGNDPDKTVTHTIVSETPGPNGTTVVVKKTVSDPDDSRRTQNQTTERTYCTGSHIPGPC